MTWWMVLLVIAAVLFAIGCIPVGVDALYRGDELTVKVKAGPVRLTILPQREKEDKPRKKPRKKQPKQAKTADPAQPAVKKKTNFLPNGLWTVFEYLQLLNDVFGDMRRKLRLEVLTIHAAFGGDPARAAIHYGQAWAAVGAITPLVDRLFVIKKRDIRPILDYNGPKQALEAQVVLTITIGRALALGLRGGIGFLKILKGGAKHESSSV